MFTELPPSDLNPFYSIHKRHFSVHCSAVTVARLIIQKKSTVRVVVNFHIRFASCTMVEFHCSTEKHHFTRRSTDHICFMTTVYTTRFIM